VKPDSICALILKKQKGGAIMYYVLCFIAGSVLTLFSMALLWMNSDTLVNELRKERERRKRLEKELDDVKKRLLYYKAEVERLGSVLGIEKWRI